MGFCVRGWILVFVVRILLVGVGISGLGMKGMDVGANVGLVIWLRAVHAEVGWGMWVGIRCVGVGWGITELVVGVDIG